MDSIAQRFTLLIQLICQVDIHVMEYYTNVTGYNWSVVIWTCWQFSFINQCQHEINVKLKVWSPGWFYGILRHNKTLKTKFKCLVKVDTSEEHVTCCSIPSNTTRIFVTRDQQYLI